MILITINKSYIVTYVNKESWYCLDIRSNTEVERYISENIFFDSSFRRRHLNIIATFNKSEIKS